MASTFRSIPGNPNAPASDSIENRIAKLELRLHDGFNRIGEAMEHGISVDNWERHWMQLLHEYEALHAELAAAA